MNEARVSVSVWSTQAKADAEQKELEVVFEKIVAYGKVRFEQDVTEHPIRGTEYTLYAYVDAKHKDYLWTFLWGYAWGKPQPRKSIWRRICETFNHLVAASNRNRRTVRSP